MKNIETKDVSVTVDAKGQPVCTPDTVTVRGKDVHLKFQVDTEGYVFPATDAVVVADPGTQFPDPSKTMPDNTKAQLRDRNTQSGDFKYTVAVQEVASGRITRLDPTIRNDA